MAVQSRDGSTCDAPGACVERGSCQRGVCVGQPKVCNDDNPCTLDRCLPGKGCIFAAAQLACDDGDACTIGDYCEAGACRPGAPAPCDDGDSCNGVERCDPRNGQCIAGTPVDCDDGLAQSCGLECERPAPPGSEGPRPEENGGERPEEVVGRDGEGGEDEGGENEGGENEGGENEGGEGPCLVGCTPVPALCLDHSECDDADVCTVDACHPTLGCVNTPVSGQPCSDGDPCTQGDVCQFGACKPGAPVSCDDGVACTADACTSSGCVNTPVAAVCPPGGACSASVCDKNEGCMQIALVDGTACDDGNPCTDGSSCSAGQCAGGSTASCDDNNPCTSDTCNPAVGCVHTALNGLACNDGDACTAADQCSQGLCVGQVATQGPGCGDVPEEAVCALSGVKGGTVDCSVQFVRKTSAAQPLTSAQMTLNFDAASLAFVQFYDSVCFGGAGCFEVAVGGSGSFALSTGHSLVMAPLTVGGWNATPCSQNSQCGAGGVCDAGLCAGSGGFGAILMLHFSNVDAPMSTAWLEGGAVQGDAEIFKMRFTLLRNISVNSPVHVSAGGLAGTNPGSIGAKMAVENMRIVSLP